jgi:hypothetical protein
MNYVEMRDLSRTSTEDSVSRRCGGLGQMRECERDDGNEWARPAADSSGSTC